LKPQFAHTDILGAILIASQVFAQTPPGRKKVLIFFSDMRQATHVVNLETAAAVSQYSAATLVRLQGLTPNLRSVRVYALGVDANGVSSDYWRHLRDIWVDYFQRTGAVVDSYSALRTIPELR
jgi:hypothetical protein